jgi:hypothetical protein
MSRIDPNARVKYALRRYLVAGAARAWNALGLDPQVLAQHARLGPELLIGQLKRHPPRDSGEA